MRFRVLAYPVAVLGVIFLFVSHTSAQRRNRPTSQPSHTLSLDHGRIKMAVKSLISI